jgi:hypothetical protein
VQPCSRWSQPLNAADAGAFGAGTGLCLRHLPRDDSPTP